ncbi:twin-arginine translocase TatA/TatE family subunit [Chitinophaga oryzae]|uniref:Sec-independent protein translocase protein TatA n=2 Tax=Chitinophaga TaxID=79328 RepID=A0AAE6ZR46_9BACT|nr:MULTISPECIES: twin-arginine translocase TatA/TatE family subunit [Chitinophaga]QJB36233.2 twin-arginine translocase TatA/TatE family subunit [Chitinophaga oryzae]QJB42729.2 twin-arginine translocase TatA/TatE family subunit [Chitinophaga oryzae]SKA20750.1 sec-independent protein translocase protein TatA [Chitinophaga eiseniae]
MATSLLNIPFLFLQEIGIKELLLIALVVLLLFGGKKIPELMRGLGSGIREFKDAKDEPKKESKGASEAPKA